MRYHNITKDDMLNGSGLRVVLWVSGCVHCCPHCQNPITWDPNGGLPFTEAERQEIFRELDKGRENRLVLDCARQHPNRYFPYALLDEDDPSFLDENFRQIVGLKEHIVLHATELTGPRKEIFARLQEYGLIMLMHTRADRRVDYVAEIVRNFPRLKIQIAHMGRAAPEDVPFMLQVIEALRPYKNVFFDTSTVRQPEVVSKAVNLTGAGRILYGSDFPFFLDRTEDIMAEQIQHVLRSGLTAEQQELIFSRNFDRLVTFGK